MQHQVETIRITLPRNAVLRAIVRMFLRAMGGRHTGVRSHHNAARPQDFDQRVREVGEW